VDECLRIPQMQRSREDGLGANKNYKGFLEVILWDKRRWMLPLRGAEYRRVDVILRKDCNHLVVKRMQPLWNGGAGNNVN
ncbi:hypothetical protein A2U01_0064736, partial [Trifolium medium]|nr:hypothetical protein [Trifolium medium]